MSACCAYACDVTASGWTFRVSRTSADYVQPFWDAITVTVIGRHLFDTTNGWDGKPAAGNIPAHHPVDAAMAMIGALVAILAEGAPEFGDDDHGCRPAHLVRSLRTGG